MSTTPEQTITAVASLLPRLELPFGTHKVQIITLCPERQLNCTESAKSNGIDIQYVSGVIPKLIAPGVLKVRRNDQDYIFNFPSRCKSNVSEYGCFIAHLYAMKEAFENSWDPWVIIGEDDVCFHSARALPMSIDDLVQRAPKDWEMINLQPTTGYDMKLMDGTSFSDFTSRRTAGTVLLCVKRHACARLWTLIATEEKNVYNLDILFKFACQKHNRWCSSDCNIHIAADITLYHVCKTYSNLCFPTVHWNDLSPETWSKITEIGRVGRCHYLMQMVVKNMLRRLDTGRSKKITITLKHLPGTFKVSQCCFNMLKNNLPAGILEICPQPIDKEKKPMPRKAATQLTRNAATRLTRNATTRNATTRNAITRNATTPLTRNAATPLTRNAATQSKCYKVGRSRVVKIFLVLK